jgi:hypothetical protein
MSSPTDNIPWNPNDTHGESHKLYLRQALQFFRTLDDMVVEACQDAIRRGLYPRVSETDLQILQNALTYQHNDDSTEDMVKYSTGIRHSKPIWDAAWRSIGVWLLDSAVEHRKLWVTQIQKYGSQAWQAALAFSVTVAPVQGDENESIRAIYDKFATVDAVLDQVYPDVHPGVERERFSDEYGDTL